MCGEIDNTYDYGLKGLGFEYQCRHYFWHLYNYNYIFNISLSLSLFWICLICWYLFTTLWFLWVIFLVKGFWSSSMSSFAFLAFLLNFNNHAYILFFGIFNRNLFIFTKNCSLFCKILFEMRSRVEEGFRKEHSTIIETLLFT